MHSYWDELVKSVINKKHSKFSFRFASKLKKYQRRKKDNPFVPLRYYLDPPYQNIYFTPREVQCLFCCQKSSQYKVIARVLNLSDRTIEAYLRKIRDKINCHTKKEMMKFIHEIGFFKKYEEVDGKISEKTK